jgi:hydrogenase maturation protease
MSGRKMVIGIGNPDRGDDSAGLHVARRLVALALPGVTVIESTGDPLALMDLWHAIDSVVLVDAAAPSWTPGRVHRLDPSGNRLPREIGLSSTHAFGLADTVELARVLGRLPARLTIYAIEVGGFSPGAPLSPAVVASVDAVAARIGAELADAGREDADA